MKKGITLIATITLVILNIHNALAQAGSLDMTFNNTGIRLYDHGTLHDAGYGIVPLSDTTAVILASSYLNGSTTGVLYRISENSDIDSTFGVDNGYTGFQIGTATYVQKLLQQPDGKYLVAGTVAVTASNERFFVARFLTDGSPDLTFNTTGSFISNYSSSMENCLAMALQSDGKIVLAGRSYQGFSNLLFTRVNSNGTLDTSFGTNGYTEIDDSSQDEEITSLAVLSSGTIVGVGSGFLGNPFWGNKVVIAKLNPNGNPISSFGGNGVMVPPIFTEVSHAWTVVSRNDSIFISGNLYGSGANNLFLTKMDSSAVADPSFGTNGIVSMSINGNVWNTGMGILLSDDGKIYNSGTTGPSSLVSEFALIRFLQDGTLDTSFDGDGIATTDIRSDWDDPYALAMQADGKILMTGMSGGLTNTGDNKIPVTRYLNDYVPFGANFTADAGTICEGGTVNFTDLSNGNVISWNWTFEGGIPATSTDQNPSVIYNTAGFYDVTLEVSDGSNISTMIKNNMITVEAIPTQPVTPVGEDNVCGNEEYVYTTSSVLYADSYDWELTPGDAGTLIANGTSATLETADDWFGSFTLKVRASNQCGDSPWSSELNGTLNFTPLVYFVQGGGGYCEGGSGIEVSLDGSDVDVNYELFLDNVSTGIIVAGTGSSISFGLQTETGIYSITGYSTYCETDMFGEAYIYSLDPPATPNLPTGPDEVCANTIADYQTDPVSNTDTLIWIVSPVEAGTVNGNGENITVNWNSNYSGVAGLSVYGSNDCADGQVSDELEVNVFAIPLPEITGETMVCKNHENNYSTIENTGSIYLWQVVGGDIVSGSNTNEIIVNWTTQGDGYIYVTETSADNCDGISDTLDIMIDDCTDLDEFIINELKLFPNPARNNVTLAFSIIKQMDYKIEIFDHFAHLVYSSKESPEEGNISHQINIGSFSNGLYYVRITTSDNKVYQSKLEVID